MKKAFVVNKLPNAAAILNGIEFKPRNEVMVSVAPVEGEALELFKNIPGIDFLDAEPPAFTQQLAASSPVVNEVVKQPEGAGEGTGDGKPGTESGEATGEATGAGAGQGTDAAADAAAGEGTGTAPAADGAGAAPAAPAAPAADAADAAAKPAAAPKATGTKKK